MKQTINKDQFRFAFDQVRPNQFSYEALGMMFDAFEDIDPEMELDVIAICCEFAESTLEEIQHDYASIFEHLDDDQKLTLGEALDCLSEHTFVIGATGQNTVIYQQF